MGTASIHLSVADIALRDPDRVAIEDNGVVITYRELDAWANGYAHGIVDGGACPGDLVAIAMTRSAAFIAAVLGTMKAGCVFLPIDIRLPWLRISSILSDAAPVACIHDGALARQAELPRSMRLVEAGAVKHRERPASSQIDRTQACAYCIYTSGSTGRPKGVLLGYEGLDLIADAQRIVFGPRPEDRIAQFASTGFDAFVFELVMALANGSGLVIVPDDVRSNPDALMAFVERTHISLIVLPPIVVAGLSRLPGSLDSTLRAVIAAGDVLPASAVRAWGHPSRLFNAYGPTEATIWTSVHECSRHDESAVVPIGKPIHGVRLYVLDTLRQPVTDGEIGEIHIGGPVVAKGYVNNLEFTAERFVPDPFAGGVARMYRSGDMGRVRADGAIEFIGRRDSQVKLRGLRIELGEVETEVRAYPEVKDAVALLRGSNDENSYLVAFAVPHSGAAVDAVDLRRQLLSRLPDYMVPARIHVLDAFPLSTSGKVDREALVRLEAVEARVVEETECPRSHEQIVVARAWCEILGLPCVGNNDEFHANGGHSLAAAQIANRVNLELNVRLTVIDVLEAATVAAIAERAVRSRRDERLQQELRANSSEPAPASVAQMQVAYANEVSGDARAYVARARLTLHGVVDVPALIGALHEIVRRHEIFRTRFETRNGILLQIVEPEVDSAITYHESPAVGDEGLEGLLARMATEVLDETRLPLVRWALVRCSSERHVLLHVEHHFVHDGWSFRLFLRELASLYSSAVTGGVSRLPEPVQFGDYARWQHSWLRSQEATQLAVHWKELLRDMPAELKLSSLETGGRASGAGRVLRFEVDPVLRRDTTALAIAHGMTPFQAMFGVFSLLVSRCAGCNEFLLGSSVANRNRNEWESVIGMIVNIVPIRISCDGSETIADFLALARTALLNALRGAELPFSSIVSTAPKRGDQTHPLAQVLFSAHSALTKDVSFAGLRVDTEEALANEMAKYPLAVTVIADAMGGASEILFEYDVGLYDGGCIERFAATYFELLAAAARDSNATAVSVNSRIPAALLPASDDAVDHVATIGAWNCTALEVPIDKCVHELFEAQVARTPDAIAVVDQNRTLTFAQLDAHAEAIACELRSFGFAPESRVAILCERSVWMIVAVLGVLKSGGAYVPLELAHPPLRLRTILSDCSAVAVITESCLATDVPRMTDRGSDGLPVMKADEIDPGMRRNDVTQAVPEPGPASLAYVIYTSGSTGAPKGVMVEHRNLVNLWAGLEHVVFSGSAVRRVALNAALSFDASLQSLLQLLSGRCVFVIPQHVRLDSDAMLAFLRRHEIEAFDCTPAQLELLMEQGLLEDLDYSPQIILVGGEAIAATPWRRMARSQARCFNAYGPTECTVDATLAIIDDAETAPHIGRPLPNVRSYVLDAQGRLLPPGVVGELYIAGAGVARGYLGDPDLTTARFVPDPFDGEGGRMYGTGDLCRWRTDGTLEFVGRKDFQVKVRGYRVELGEIESALRSIVGVREAAVVATGERTQALVAFVRMLPGSENVVSRLHESLSAILPGHMVPSEIHGIEAFPLNSSGKVDRSALIAEWATSRRRVDGAEDALSGDVGQTLARLLSEIDPLVVVRSAESFDSQGFHSLSIMRLAALCRREFGIRLTVMDIRECETPGRLCEWIIGKLRSGRATTYGASNAIPEPLVAIPRDDALPLSPPQEQLWVLSQRSGVSVAYHVRVGLRLSGPLDVVTLRRALELIVQRHDILRTGYMLVDGIPRQHVVERPLTFVMRDLCGECDVDPQCDHQLAEWAHEPFDLANGYVFRAGLVRKGMHEHHLQLVVHHIAADGWSLDVLLSEFAKIHGALVRGEPSPLAPLKLQYADYAAWCHRQLENNALGESREYWRRALSDLPQLSTVPTDRMRPAVQDFCGALVQTTMDAELVQRLSHLAKRHNASMFEVLLAGWSAVLMGAAGQNDFAIGVPFANREQIETHGLIGYFVNTLVVRLNGGGDPSVAEWLQRVKQASRAAQANAGVWFSEIVELASPIHSLSHSPLFQTFFAWYDRPNPELMLPGMRVECLPHGQHETAKFDLTLHVERKGEQIEASLEYATALFDKSTVERLLNQWVQMLRTVLSSEDKLLAETVSPLRAEMPVVPMEWNATACAFPSDRCLHGLFEDCAQRTPDAIALFDDTRQLSYREVNEQSNRIAHYLRALQVDPDEIVALCAERSVDMAIAMLGILKAGAAYLPIDPQTPEDRLNHVLTECSVRIVLAQAQVLDAFPQLARYSVLPIDAEARDVLLADRSIENHTVGVTSRNLAYVMYTSGSAGQPKGVMVEHRNVVRLVVNNSFALLTPEDCLAHCSNPAFDASTWELWGALTIGARVRVIAPAVVLDPQMFCRHLVESGVTALWMTVGLFNEYVDLLGPAFEQLRYLLVGGDALDPRAIARLLAAEQRPQRIINGYGPTETTTFAATHHIVEVSPLARSIPIGKPIANTQIHILDHAGRPAPIGVKGEICIGGPGVARGYLNQAELTAEKFVVDRFSDEPGARLYRSGDLGCWRSDGTIEYLGREDQQVKIRGFRIEPAEIEAQLVEHPAVQGAAVVAIGDGADKRLIAYVVANPNSAEELRIDLRRLLETKLPHYMVPGTFAVLQRLPLTANGKLDRRALPEAFDGGVPTISPADAPHEGTEAALAALWQDLLPGVRIKRSDNFFEIGGYSLLAVRLISRVRRVFEIDLTVADVFEYPRLHELAECIVNMQLSGFDEEQLATLLAEMGESK